MPAAAAHVAFPVTNTTVTLRKARVEDCDVMLRMIEALAEYQGVGDRVHVTAAELRRAGFGPVPQFEAIIADRFRALRPDLRVLSIENAAHNVHRDRADIVNAEVLAFLAS